MDLETKGWLRGLGHWPGPSLPELTVEWGDES